MARDRQRARTRKDLLRAAARLMGEGRTPTLEEVAEVAMVSRATAYRYFPGMDALLVEAALDLATPEVDAVLGPDAPSDLVARLDRVDAAFDAMMRSNEAPLRTMLVHALQHQLRAPNVPVRQNRRTPMIEAAIAPHRGDLPFGVADRLAQALALVIGTESMLVLNDVLGLDVEEATAVRRWAIRALVARARS